jgi:hypothetical protein
MGAGSSKQYYELLVAPEWAKGVESLTLVSDVSKLVPAAVHSSTNPHAT